MERWPNQGHGCVSGLCDATGNSTMKRQRHRLGYDFEIIKVPRELFALGRRRTEKMLAYQSDRMSLADLLANAYLQGIEDGYQTAEHMRPNAGP